MKKYVDKIIPYNVISQDIYINENNDGVMKLDWNESDYSPSDYVKQQITNFINNDFKINWYSDVKQQKLRNKISEYININKEYIEFFAGSDYSFEIIVKTFLNDCDNVMMLSPTYDQFRLEMEQAGCNVYKVFPDNMFKVSVIDIINKIKMNKYNLVYICNPNNPTGWFLNVEDIKRLLLEFPNIVFVIDETYIEYLGKDLSSSFLVNNFSNIIILRSFSKAFALAGLRIGYVLSCKENIDKLNIIRNSKCINRIAEVAAIATIDDLNYYVNNINIIKKEIKFFCEKLKSININFINTNVNFVLIKIDKTKEIQKYLSKHKIYIRDVSNLPFLKGYIRIAGSFNMKKVFNLIERFIDENGNC